jgi:hypothetical protein
MPSALGSLSSALGGAGTGGAGLSSLGQILGLGSSGYNLYNQYQNQQYQNNLRSYAQDPAKMNAYAAQFTQPLNAGLTADVGNQSQSYLAQRGLSDSPQISQEVESQALAPYVQQNQQAGYQDALAALGLGGGAINPGAQQQNSQAQLAKTLSGLGGQQLSPYQALYLAQQTGNNPAPTPSSTSNLGLIAPDASGGMQDWWQQNGMGS